jgi:hypothetical protein
MFIGDLIKRKNNHNNSKIRHLIKFNTEYIIFIKFLEDFDIHYEINESNLFIIDN